MKNVKNFMLVCFGLLFFVPAYAQKPAFKHRGFYLHEGWYFNYPFAVKTWAREDYARMFHLLRSMEYDQVALWPMLEAIPNPLSKVDELAIREFRHTIEDAHAAALECWLVQNANLTPNPSIAALPWKQRIPYDSWKQVRLDNPAAAESYLNHRTAMMAILNNADAYVTIDGDPGGYMGAKPEEWLIVFLSDRSALDRYGVNPSKQRLIPWIWSGWGAGAVWGGNPLNSPLLIKPYTGATMKLFKTAMPEPWEMLAGRSHRDDWANGRVNVSLADSLGLMDRSIILCYEAIEFEPTPPASILQFDLIRNILREESKYATTAAGVFGNAQQPIMVMPNIYFFARGSYDLTYLDKTDEEVLKDFASFLGGSSEILIPAWSCLQRNLETLPHDLPKQLRSIKLTGQAADYIPGGSKQYLEILATETESRIMLLRATAAPATTNMQAAENITKGIMAMVNWWSVHRYVGSGKPDEQFNWSYVHSSQVSILQNWSRKNVKDTVVVSKLVTKLLSKNKTLSESQVTKILEGLFSD
jgi:hypothetical protein